VVDSTPFGSIEKNSVLLQKDSTTVVSSVVESSLQGNEAP